MHATSLSATIFRMGRLLGLVCLLFVTAQLTFAQADPTISIGDVVAPEGDTGAAFGALVDIALSAPSTKTINVTVTTQQGTATSDVDFGAGSIVLTFQPGQTLQQLTVFVIGDTAVEGTEEFFLNLSNPVNATIARGQGTCTIIDDDSLQLFTQPGSQRAAAIDSVNFLHESFPIINDGNFSSDHRTRIAVFATGVKFANGEPTSNLTASAEDPQAAVRPLTVEFVGKVPGFPWLTEIVLKVNDQLPLNADEKIRISLHGATSNFVLVAIGSR